MKIYQNIKLSIKALFINKTRTIFSILGMAVGIAAVVVTMAIGEGAKQIALKPIKAMGTNVLLINSGIVKKVFGREKQVSSVTTLKLTDVEWLSEIKGIKYISPFQEQSLIIEYQNIKTNTLIQGVWTDFPLIKNYSLKSGRLFSKFDNEVTNKVAIIGSDVKKNLYKNEDPIDKTIFINKIPFTIIGVFNTKGLEAEMGNIDNIVIIPINTALRRVFNMDYINKIYISIESLDIMETIEKEAIDILRNNHKLNITNKENDFTIVNQQSVLKASEETTEGFNNLIIGVAIVSLFVGGIGILAVMILSVKERINEIGLRKSVGAKNKNITFQFLSEALLLGITGGILGALTGIIVAILLNNLSEWNTFISWQGITVSFMFSVATALVFGIFPASQAARMNPIEALKSE